MQMTRRPRRNRKSKAIRDLVQESHLRTSDLIAPLFLIDHQSDVVDISSMPGQQRLGTDPLLRKVNELSELGLSCISLFPACADETKDPKATQSYNPEHFYLKAITRIKKEFPEMLIMSDVAMDPYSSDGHDGIVESGEILNDPSLDILAKMAVAQANAGSDIVGPSDMMDGRIGYIRDALDENNHKNISIMSYTAKYASSFYGPFREALDSAPKNGDKKTYQMNPANSDEALIEAQLDIEEGADILMVKPGLPYLDIIAKLKENFEIPVAAYNVSGEYAMIHAAAEKGWLDLESTMMESLLSFKRAGADIILTYFAQEAATLLKEN